MREAGVAREVAAVVSAVLVDDECPPWLREVAGFVLGELGESSACFALETAASAGEVDEQVRHTALYAVGDIGHRTPRAIHVALDLLAKPDVPVSVTRAAAYALAALTPTSPEDSSADEQEAALVNLEKRVEADEVTRALAHWGLENLSA